MASIGMDSFLSSGVHYFFLIILLFQDVSIYDIDLFLVCFLLEIIGLHSVGEQVDQG